jgi:quinol monooxygenase YgiN
MGRKKTEPVPCPQVRYRLRQGKFSTGPIARSHRAARGFVADLELAVVIGSFEARTGRQGDLAAVLAKYVVLTRRQPACRNVDLVASGSRPDRLVVIEKWESADDARAHLDAPETVEMALAARDVLANPPDLDLFESISAQDLE